MEGAAEAAGFMMPGVPDEMFQGNPFLEQLLGSMGAMGPARGGVPGSIIVHGSTRRPQGVPPGGGDDDGEGAQPHGGLVGHGGAGPDVFLGDHFLRSLISNLTGMPIGAGGGGGGHGGQIHFTLGGGGGPGGNVMYGNPGDYVWGRGGFDAIVTQLLNQLEGTGPPPMPKANIDKEVQTIQITQQHVEESLQCSVCWDDFKVDESVRQLRCEHIFHKDCIVPWLELHATCPVCRQPLTEDAKAHAERQDQEDAADVPAMAAAAQAAAAAGGSAGSSAASSSNQSSDGSMPPRPDRPHRPAPQRNTHRTYNLGEAQQQMDVSDSLTDTISAVINSFMGGAPQPSTSSSSNSGNSGSSGGESSSGSGPPRNPRPDFEDFDPE